MAWIEERTPEEIAAQIKAVMLSKAPPADDFDRGWRAAVEKITEFIQSDGE